MKKSKIVAGISALAISLSAFSAPQVLASETNTQQAGGIQVPESSPEISFESSNGTEIIPEETIVFTADDWDEGTTIRNAYIQLEPGYSTPLWDVEHDVNEDGAPQVTITAPETPEEQITADPLDYGEYLVRIRTSKWNDVYFTVNFVEEYTPEEESIWDRLTQLSSNLSS